MATEIGKRTEAEIREEILDCYVSLSPENLTCDGELPSAQVRVRVRALQQRLRELFTEIGYEVSEVEAYSQAK